MGRLGAEGEEVPDVVGLLAIGVGVDLLAVDEVGELERIPEEEDRHPATVEKRAKTSVRLPTSLIIFIRVHFETSGLLTSKLP
jgi:hypothetical protein